MVNTCVLYRQFLQFLKTYSIIVIVIRITAITITITVVIFIINFIMHILLIIISSRVGYVKHIYPVIFLVIH